MSTTTYDTLEFTPHPIDMANQQGRTRKCLLVWAEDSLGPVHAGLGAVPHIVPNDELHSVAVFRIGQSEDGAMFTNSGRIMRSLSGRDYTKLRETGSARGVTLLSPFEAGKAIARLAHDRDLQSIRAKLGGMPGSYSCGPNRAPDAPVDVDYILGWFDDYKERMAEVFDDNQAKTEKLRQLTSDIAAVRRVLGLPGDGS